MFLCDCVQNKQVSLLGDTDRSTSFTGSNVSGSKHATSKGKKRDNSSVGDSQATIGSSKNAGANTISKPKNTKKQISPVAISVVPEDGLAKTVPIRTPEAADQKNTKNVPPVGAKKAESRPAEAPSQIVMNDFYCFDHPKHCRARAFTTRDVRLARRVVDGRVLDTLRDGEIKYDHDEDVIMFAEPEERSIWRCCPTLCLDTRWSVDLKYMKKTLEGPVKKQLKREGEVFVESLPEAEKVVTAKREWDCLCTPSPVQKLMHNSWAGAVVHVFDQDGSYMGKVF